MGRGLKPAEGISPSSSPTSLLLAKLLPQKARVDSPPLFTYARPV